MFLMNAAENASQTRLLRNAINVVPPVTPMSIVLTKLVICSSFNVRLVGKKCKAAVRILVKKLFNYPWKNNALCVKGPTTATKSLKRGGLKS